MNRRRRLLMVGIVLGMILSILQPGRWAQAGPLAQTLTPDPEQQARQLVSSMTPEEKVGQLFLVTFHGRDVTSKDSKILDLIQNHHIGGVVLTAANDNFTNAPTVLSDTYKMILDLQAARWQSSQVTIQNPFGFTYTPQYVPLFVGISQDGDLYPSDQLLSGMTPLPSEMAVGATWQPSEAEQIGNVLGKELSILGFNLLLGPSLDLAEGANLESANDLGVQVFGQDPFWAGQMGQAFIQGVHQGSNNTIGVVGHSFPGIGAADRSPETEVATVRKTQEQLKQNELVPYYAVTGDAANPAESADGLQIANIRYQGWQGAIRSNTRPLSLDSAALDQILALPEFTSWRQQGGVLVSDNLGSPALKNYYDVTGQAFDPRQVARSVFLGGSDILYDDNLIAPGDPDSYTTLIRILDFFVQKYREDSAFAQRVDSSVRRILMMKYRLYGTFDLATITPDVNQLDQIGTSEQTVFDLARQSVTLMYPSQSEVSQVLPRPPDLRERIFFLTDVVNYHQCSSCPAEPALAVDALQNAVNRLYGPRAAGLVNPANLMSYSFLDLKYYLDDNQDKVPQGFVDNLNLADWVVVALLNNDPARPESQALLQLLAQQPELLRNKKVVVFAFNTPYYLDATDISKISAYYALYSKTAPFVEVAARILFQELTPAGALPVSVMGAGYDLSVALSPDPNQVIPLEVDLPAITATGTPTANPLSTLLPNATSTIGPTVSTSIPTVLPTVKVGDLLPLRTGVIYDHNHNPVPDGTPVQFIFTATGAESGVSQQITVTTVGGVARASYRIQSGGSLEVRVTSDPALSSKQLRLNISPSGDVGITAVTPTVTPSSTPTPTMTVTPSPTATLTPTATPTPLPPPQPGAGEWLLSLIIAWGAGAGFFWLGRSTHSLRWGVRWGLLATAGGLLVYTYLVAGFPGGPGLIETSGPGSLMWLTLLGAMAGWLIGFFWKRSEGSGKRAK